jgi:uncharacterized protein (AIM24 family)
MARIFENKIIFVAILMCYVCHNAAFAHLSEANNRYFIENKGQIHDQNGCPREDVQFALQIPGMSIFVGDNQVHYTFISKHGDSFHTQRLDVELLNSNPNVVVEPFGQSVYYENYYIAGCPKDGIRVRTFSGIVYKNVYDHIDWMFFVANGRLEQEFVVHAGGNPEDIQIKYAGADELKIDENGALIATTPMGVLTEHPPICTDAARRNGTSSVHYQLKGNILSYSIKGATEELVIDPILEWGTYYGYDSSNTGFFDIKCNGGGSLFGTGLTWSGQTGTIATGGTYSSTYVGMCDAFLVKFDTAGNRIWGTYYGGDNGNWGVGVAYDSAGNIYMAGQTMSTTGVSTPGCQQPVYGGGLEDGFITKFDSTGNRIWATYCGGSGANIIASISCDNYGHFYVSGETNDGNNIATPGGFYPTPCGGYDDFLMKYDTSGLLLWGTYYGGSGSEYGGAHATDGRNVFLVGSTGSTSGIATLSSHQPTYGGGNDDFLVKFDSSGNRIWATYFGGTEQESTGGVICDNSGSIIMFGTTNSDASIATAGAFRTSRAGGQDAFLAKFRGNGALNWSTYFGGDGTENNNNSRICVDNSGNIYVAGYTDSDTGIASTGTWQSVFGGGTDDGFLAKFDGSGNRIWSTYYGGTGLDEATTTAFDGANVYVSGKTTSPSHIATPGSFLDSGGGLTYYNQAFLAKFLNTPDSTPVEVPQNLNKSQNRLLILPTVNSGDFNLECTLTGKLEELNIRICNQAGETVYDVTVDSPGNSLIKHIMLRDELAAGTYTVKLIANNTVLVSRFTKI